MDQAHFEDHSENKNNSKKNENQKYSSDDSFSKPLKMILVQMNFHVANIEHNQQKIRKVLDYAQNAGVSLVVFPEMSLVGYPIQDLIFDRDFFETELNILRSLAADFPDLWIIIGGFGLEEDPHHHPKYQNLAYVLNAGKIQRMVQKRLLPTYDVFDEKRYFWPGNDFSPIVIDGYKIGIAICEDLWDSEYQADVAKRLVEEGAELIISINGSPYVIEKQKIRENIVLTKAKNYQVPVVYLNLLGGQDELVFDGRSFAFNPDGTMVFRAEFCEESLIFCEAVVSSITPTKIREIELVWKHVDEFLSKDIQKKINENHPTKVLNKIGNLFSNKAVLPLFDINEEIVKALSMNLRDYYQKTGIFKRIVLGLSGGIDSAFTAVIAAEAIGPEKVTAILMPSKYSSKGSIDDSIELCKNLGINYHIVPIKEAHSLMEPLLIDYFIYNNHYLKEKDLKFNLEKPPEWAEDLAKQNLQSRLRGIILMFYSNLYSALLVSTGNKSELATGYCTLYGDTNGGKNVPGDLYKTQLYRVCEWINREKEIIPRAIIEKPPSAELKENQVDEDNLPPYPVLDEILRLRIDEGYSPREIIAMGKDEELVRKIDNLYTRSEYKRAQVAQTIKINKKAFGMGRKIPVLKRSTY